MADPSSPEHPTPAEGSPARPVYGMNASLFQKDWSNEAFIRLGYVIWRR